MALQILIRFQYYCENMKSFDHRKKRFNYPKLEQSSFAIL